MQQLSAGGQRPTVTYRAELSGRALKQIHGLPSRRSTVSSRLWRKSSITRRSAPDLSDERPLRQASRVRRRRPDPLLINDGAGMVVILDITWAG